MMDETKRPDPKQLQGIGRQCLCANVRRASRALTSLYDQFLQPSGLLATQFNVLSALATQSEIAITPLAEQLGMDPTTLARNLKPLEREGWVQVLPGTDRRTRIVQLTDEGLAVLQKAIPYWEAAQAWLIQQLGEDRWQPMLADWSTLISAAQKE